MRRFLLMFAVVAAMVFTGCSDDDNKVSNPLSGTTWEHTEDGILTSLSFNDSECRLVIKYASSSTNFQTTIYTYTYDEPKVTLNPLEEELAVMEGIISGSAMVVTNASSGKEIGVFIKQ